MKEDNCSYKLRYEEYLELICGCLSSDMYIELTHLRVSYEETLVYMERLA